MKGSTKAAGADRGAHEPLWGGGFDAPMHPALERISVALADDLPLADADLRASAAYARALARCGVLSGAEGERLSATLDAMRDDLAVGTWVPSDAEDIHTAIEAEVTRRVGELGERLHTGRSRNDQVATAFRMAVRERAATLIAAVREVQGVLTDRAERELDTLLPAYTHIQRAQPARLAHWLLGHFWPLQRDAERLATAAARANVLPLGSGAVTGNAFGLDREGLARELGFVGLSPNSIDAVGDRDFAAEIVFACTLLALHLSRLAEDLVLWSSAEFGFVRWPDALATGSSLMPNKRNPDLAELVRGRSAGALGELIASLALLKGLPSSYQRDLQEGKASVWRATDSAWSSLAAMAAALTGVEFDRERMREALSDDLLATEAADAMVARGVTFRQAHRAVARAVAQARRQGVALRELGRGGNEALPELLRAEDLHGLDFDQAVERHAVEGGTARRAVETQLDRARAVLAGGLP